MRISRSDLWRWRRRGSRGEFLRGAAFLAGVRAHLRHPLTVQQAGAILRRRLARRDADFLALMQQSVFGYRQSPYLPLLRRAGCEYGDLAALVRRDGLESALGRLLREGVYLTVAETKGRRPAVRGVVQVAAELLRLRTPAWRVAEVAPPDGAVQRMGLYQAMITDVAVGATLFVDARRGTAWRHARWSFTRVGTEIHWNLRLTGPGYGVDRWFSQVDPATWPIHVRAFSRFASLMGAQAGIPLPGPEHAPVENPRAIIEWMTETRRAGGTPHLQSVASALVTLAQEAVRQGQDLEGVQLSPSAEPLTPARLAALRAAGAEAVPSYGANEVGQIGWGCLAPAATDDMHLTDDRFAVIQPGSHDVDAGLPPNALLFTSLRAAWPMVLLNVSLGDQAVLERRPCGCPLGEAGWQTHVHDVRSFDKLKIEPLRDPAAVIRLVEEILPRRFGGTPADFQLVDDETHVAMGQAPVRLLVHPRVGPVETHEVMALLLELDWGPGTTVNAAWRDRNWVTVERRAPYRSAGGKIYHVHQLTGHGLGTDSPRAAERER